MDPLTTLALYLGAALLAGTLAHLVRLPPLVGFLIAGFALGAAGADHLPELDVLAEAGITLLLFGIGLKLDPATLFRREVWQTAGVHMAASVAVIGSLLWAATLIGWGLLGELEFGTAVLIAFALSFSSTVLVVKTLDERSESRSLYGVTAIGILVLQDVAAAVFILFTDGVPKPTSVLLLLLLVPAVPLMRFILSRIGHGEMLALFAVAAAFVPGYALFEAAGIKGDFGALVIGALLASHSRAESLSKAILSTRELLLVGFFLSVGLTGTLTAEAVVLGMALAALVPLKSAAYVLLLRAERLRNRTALRTGLALGNYSEFGLIVLAAAVSSDLLGEQWLVVAAVAVASSFVLSASLSRRGTDLVDRLESWLPEQRREPFHYADRPIDIGHVDAVVFGMGRVGRAAYEQLVGQHGLRVAGVDSDRERVTRLQEAGLEVVEADATDHHFWERLKSAGEVDLAVLAMPFHGANVVALDQLRASDFAGAVAVVTQWDDEMLDAEERGVDAAVQIYDGAGIALADRASAALHERAGA